ncbi:MAG: Ig-like domain-containing protein [Solirubrobacteraceae bacterium]
MLSLAAIAPSAAGAATYPQCPPVDKDTGCQFLVTVTSGGETIAEDASQGPYEGSDDALVGVQNESSSPITSIHLSAENELFGFEGDGICSPGGPPIAPGCMVQPENPEKTKSTRPGIECVYGTEERKGKLVPEEVIEDCAFNPPAGEPAALTFPAGIAPVALAANGDQVSGYEGPTSWFSNIGPLGSNTTGAGTINFSPAIPAKGSAYFSLESPPAGGFGSASTLSTTLSGGGQTGASITVLQGASVTDAATLGGANASIATGTVAYNVYSDSACTHLVTAAGAGALASGAAAASTAANLAPGVYYWQASYGGDANNKAISSVCGSEVLTVQAPTTTTTIQSGGGVIGASIPVLKGSAVTDTAHIAGAQAASATGTVTYTLYKEAKCKAVLATSIASVTGGVAGASAPVSPAVGTYYWVASYSGGGLNAPSVSACGSEKLIVSVKANLGLPNGKKCFSKRAFAIHPHFPKGAKIVSYQEFINGKLAKQGKLSKNATSVNLIGLPKGAYKVELLTFAANGASYEDTRTFHTCVRKKHKKH